MNKNIQVFLVQNTEILPANDVSGWNHHLFLRLFLVVARGWYCMSLFDNTWHEVFHHLTNLPFCGRNGGGLGYCLAIMSQRVGYGPRIRPLLGFMLESKGWWYSLTKKAKVFYCFFDYNALPPIMVPWGMTRASWMKHDDCRTGSYQILCPTYFVDNKQPRVFLPCLLVSFILLRPLRYTKPWWHKKGPIHYEPIHHRWRKFVEDLQLIIDSYSDRMSLKLYRHRLYQHNIDKINNNIYRYINNISIYF